MLLVVKVVPLFCSDALFAGPRPVMSAVLISPLAPIVKLLVPFEFSMNPAVSVKSSVPLTLTVAESSETVKAATFSVAPESIVKFVLTVKSTPGVVVPALIVKLLNVVKTVAGRVLVAVRITVPAPGVKVAPVLETAIDPVWSVPPEVMLMVLV